MPGPWKSDSNGDSTPQPSGKQHRPSSSMIIEDASPPLPWQEPSHRFLSEEDLGVSQRFGMDAISGGAFAMPASETTLIYSQQFPAPSDTSSRMGNSHITEDTLSTTQIEAKKRRWGPKGQKTTGIESESKEKDGADTGSFHSTAADKGRTLFNDTTFTENQHPTSTSLFDSSSGQQTTSTSSSSVSETGSGKSTAKGSKKSQRSKSSTFGLRTLSGSGTTLVSGLTSLRNSIMIPALSSSTLLKNEKTNAASLSNSLTTSQSSLLDFVVDDFKPGQTTTNSASSSTMSPSLFQNAFPRSVNDLGSSSLYLDNKDISPADPRAHHSIMGLGLERRSSTSSQRHHHHLQQYHPAGRRKRMESQNSSATKSLSRLESEFQQLIQRQGHLSTHKVELGKELLSLYSRRNMNERRQETAVKEENFEEANSAATTISQVQERILKLEGIYTETDRSLWACKKRQDELAQSIKEMHQAVMHEAEEVRQSREKEKEEFEVEMKKRHETELETIMAGREDLEKERSDLALGRDFLGKNEAELLERMEEETKTEQEELDGLMEKRETTRGEILELTRKLEQLNQQDKDLILSIGTLQQKIRLIAQQFDGKAKEVAHEKREHEHRVAHIQQKSSRLDRQEANVQNAARQAEATREEMSNAIHAIVAQQDRLEQVRLLFETELSFIQKLRLEEEMFREKEAGWTLRANSLNEDLNKSEARISQLTTKIAADQKTIQDLEREIQTGEKQISTTESVKALSVQRRDFKQASQCSSEIAKCRETITQQKQELETLLNSMQGPSQEALEKLQSEHGTLSTFVKDEEAALFKEIHSATTATWTRLSAFFSTKESGAEIKDKGDVMTNFEDSTTQEEGSSGDLKNAATYPEVPKLSGMLLSEMLAEIESIREVSRIRFGREETAPGMLSTTLPDASNSVAAKADEGGSGVDKEERRHALERDIQAAVVEEDYDTAAELQGQLDALQE
ncbi:hypothetical protein BGX28_001232 [Mortierella sp. GBA30]|nr:hypothetical protein BGX28_001232 [Mortierella sp. GBA30]